MGDAIMAVSYKRLWKLLVDKEMSKSDFANCQCKYTLKPIKFYGKIKPILLNK